MDATTPTRRSPRVRAAWRIGGGMLTVVVLVFASASIVSALAHEEETVRETFDASELRSLEVDSRAGSVRIVGGEGDSIEMVAEVSHGLRRTDLSWQVEGDRLYVESSCPILFSQFCFVTFTFYVPREIALDIHSDSSVTADTIDGNAVLSVDSGHVEATRMAGNLRLDADAGRVSATSLSAEHVQASSDAGRVELLFVEPPRNVVADSDAGSVEVVVPGGGQRETYQVYDETDAGDTEVTVDRSVDADRSISATTDSGSVTVRYSSN